MTDKLLTVTETMGLLQSLVSLKKPLNFDESKQVLRFADNDHSPCALTIPLALPKLSGDSAGVLLQQIETAMHIYTLILIQAGAAALGYFVGGELVHHRVIKRYMVRKKQGKSQIKHLKTKGKSRLGSRIRLRNSILFFEGINQTLTEWDISSQSESILMSVPINLRSHLFGSNVPVPFKKKDPRIKKIPVDIRVPSFKELSHINWLVSRGRLIRLAES